MKKLFSCLIVALTLVTAVSCSKGDDTFRDFVTVPSPTTNIELIISNVVVDFSTNDDPEAVVRNVMASNSFDETTDETDHTTMYIRSAHMTRQTAYRILSDLNKSMSNSEEVIVGSYDWAMIVDGDMQDSGSASF